MPASALWPSDDRDTGAADTHDRVMCGGTDSTDTTAANGNANRMMLS
jgi:hypothetical protein